MNTKHFIAIFLGLGLFISCSNQKFSSVPTKQCQESNGCTVNPDGSETYSEDVSVPDVNDKVDILFVVDNSGSMIEEQREIANRFSQFLNILRLPNGQFLNYRVAIATTDNQSGSQEWKDGRLVPFRNGNTVTNLSWIDNNTPNKEFLFSSTIQRPETIYCSQMGYGPGTCQALVNVSGDERGTLTAQRAASRYTNGAQAFIRPEAMLHVIFVADEDVRSNGGGFSGMPLENSDLPSVLVSTYNSLPAAQGRKRFQFHSIVNIPQEFSNYESFMQSGFTNCVNRQVRDTSRNEYDGCHYAMSTALTGGFLGSIDDTNYSGIFSNIGSSVVDTSLAQIDLRCVPVGSVVTLSPIEGRAYPSSLPNPATVSTNGNKYVVFNPRLAPGAGVRISYTCPRN